MQLRHVDARSLHGRLRDIPRSRAFGTGDVHLRVRLLLIAQVLLEIQAGERGWQDEDSRHVHAEGYGGHALAEERAFAASVRRAAIVDEGTVLTTAHDDATRHRHPAALHADQAHLGAVLDYLQGVAHDARRDLDRIRDDQLGQSRAAGEGIVADGRYAFGQDDARHHLVVGERRGTDLNCAREHRVVGDRVSRRGEHQVQAVCHLAVEDILIGRKHLITSTDGQGRDVAVVVQSGLAESGHARAQVELGDTRAVGERLLTDRGHRIRQGHGLHARATEPEVSDCRQLVQVGTEIDAVLGSHSLEGASLNRDSAAQVDGVEAGREAEGARAHRVEALWQGQRGEGGETEGLVADGAQRRRQSDGHDTRLDEGLIGDLGGTLRDRVGAAGVLRRWVNNQTRVVLGEQDAVHGLVVGVRVISLNRDQGGRLGVARGDRLGGDLRAEGQRGQSLVVVNELGTNRRDGTRQGQGFQRHVREGSLADQRQLRGRGHVVLEGNCLQRGVDERLVADGTRGGGDRHVLHGGVRECPLADVGDALGEDNVGRTALVGGQHAVLVDLEVVGVGGAHGHGDLRGLGRTARCHGCAQRARAGAVAGRQRRARRIRAGHDGAQIGGFNAPGHRGTRQGGSQVCLRRGLLAHLHGQGGLQDLDTRFLGDCAHVDGGRGRQGRLSSVSHGDRRVTRTHRADLAGIADGGHGLVRGGPHQVGDVRVRPLVGGIQRDLVTRDNRGLGG